MPRLYFITIFLIAFCFAGAAQVKFYATIDPGSVAKSEYTQYRLIIENAGTIEQVQPPAFKDFVLMSGPNQERGMSNNNGAVTNYIALAYVLKPRSTGNFTIPTAYAKIDGRRMSTNPVRITVTSQPAQNVQHGSPFSNAFGGMDPFGEPARQTLNSDFILAKGENPAEKIKRNMFVRLETDKTSCYVGEPVVATYKLYTRLPSESNMTKNPSFNGFSVIDLRQANTDTYEKENYKGRMYNVYIIRKAQLYPLQSGQLELEVAEIENNVHFIKSEYVDKRGMADEMLAGPNIPAEALIEQKVTLRSEPLSINVKPLPEAGKPASFKGAVGKFDIEATLTSNQFTTDDAGELNLIISGVGNLQLVTAPSINWPQGIEGFEPRTNDDLFKATIPVSGRKIMAFPFTVATAGNYKLDSIEFSFFDPKEGRYKIVKTKPLSFTVSKGTGKKVLPATVEKDKDSLLTRFFSKRWRVVSVVAVLILLGLIFWLKRDHKEEKNKKEATLAEPEPVESHPVESILQQQQNPLSQTEVELANNNPALFYRKLDGELKQYLAHKLSIVQADLNKKGICEELDKTGVTNETCLELVGLMDEIEWQLYTPFSGSEKMQQLYDRSNAMIQLLNTYKS